MSHELYEVGEPSATTVSLRVITPPFTSWREPDGDEQSYVDKVVEESDEWHDMMMLGGADGVPPWHMDAASPHFCVGGVRMHQWFPPPKPGGVVEEGEGGRRERGALESGSEERGGGEEDTLCSEEDADETSDGEDNMDAHLSAEKRAEEVTSKIGTPAWTRNLKCTNLTSACACSQEIARIMQVQKKEKGHHCSGDFDM